MNEVSNNESHQGENQPSSDKATHTESQTSTQRVMQRPETAERNSYEFFPNQEARQELMAICSKLADYAHDNTIKNLVIVDRSARLAYIGVKDLWKQRYPDDAMPDIYFVNPTGFINKEQANQDTDGSLQSLGEKIMMESLFNENDVGDPTTDTKTQQAIEQEFGQTYQRLMPQKDQATLLFDTCIHEGDTIKPLHDTLQNIGFTDIKVGVVGNDRNTSTIQPDFIAVEGVPLGICHPFDKDKMIERRFDSVTSRPTINLDPKERSIRLRKELHRIFSESPTTTA